MKLFISWSGEFSQKVAEALSIWIPTIIQSVEVFFSPDDIAKGENWSNRLSEELDNCSFGIVCLTPENVAAPWIHFEAGALSKSLNARISTIMLNVSPSDVKGPLAYYQNTAFERNDFFRLFQSINKSSDVPLKPEILRNSFNNAWNNLSAEIKAIIDLYAVTTENPPSKDSYSSDSDALQEILRLVRKADTNQLKNHSRISMREPPHVYRLEFNSGNVPAEYILNLIQDHLMDKTEQTYMRIRQDIADSKKVSCKLYSPFSQIDELCQQLHTAGVSRTTVTLVD